MNVTFPTDFKINAWYRGTKVIKVQSMNSRSTVMTNNDKFTQQDHSILLNGTLFTNIPNITPEDLGNIYKYNLIKRGYKILD